jgi:hypothetical protein
VLRGRKGAGGLEHFVGTGADAKVVGEIDPTDCAGGVDEELRRAGDIVALHAGALVEQVVAADCFGIGIREKRVRVTGFAAKVLRFRWRVDADGDGLDAQFLEILQTVLNTP